MSTEKVRGVVIKEVSVGESDKIITLLTKERGKMTVSARGARRAKSKYLASCELFAYSDFVVYVARKYPSVSSAALIDSFYGLRKDLYKMTAAAYAAEFCCKMIYEGTDCSDYMLLFLRFLKQTEKDGTSPLLNVYAFELKFLSLSGMLPDFRQCRKCGKRLEAEGFAIKEGLLCESCGEGYNGDGFKISCGCVKALNYISNSAVDKTFNFKVSDRALKEIEKVRNRLMEEQVDVSFKSFDMLKEIFGLH